MINKQGKFSREVSEGTEKLGRKLCEFCAFLWLLQKFFDQAIDVNTRRVEEMDAVMFIRAQQ
jgi:hypothetical protein